MPDLLTSLTLGLPLVLTMEVLPLAVLGAFLGVVIGALPGLTSAMAVAILVPLTYGLQPIQAFALLLPAFATGTFGGSIAAIFVNIPGTGAAVMTALDGYPMRQRGEAGRAVAIATLASFAGGVVGTLFLAAAAPALAIWALRFGAHEFLAIALFGLAIMSVIGASVLKGLLALTIGLMLATVGMDSQTAVPRYTFGHSQLLSGLNFVPVMVGLFGISEILLSLERLRAASAPARVGLAAALPRLGDMLRVKWAIARSTVIGLLIGLMPAAGPTIASVVAYGVEKRVGRNRAEVGTGAPEGVAAAESANNAATGGALVPMFALGIPGDAVTAIMIGAFLIHGLQPGPALFLQSPQLVSGLYILFLIGNIGILVFGLLGAGWLVRLLDVPQHYLMPALLALCLLGSFAVQNSLFDIWVLIVFGLFGYGLRKLGIPVAPLILGFILGPLVEDNLRRVLFIDNGSLWPMLMRPISGPLLALTVLMLALPLVLSLLRWSRRRVARGRAR